MTRDFIGRDALMEWNASGGGDVFTGVLLEGRGVIRHGQAVHTDAGEGEVTSGTYSPTLERSIGLARLPGGSSPECEVDIRGRRVPARLVEPPFVRRGRIRIEL